MSATAYVDLRCLQDPKYRVRGIGHHLTALLRARQQSACADWKVIGLVNPESPKLPPECASLVDAVSPSANPSWNGAPVVFIDGTPMTHDPRYDLRFQKQSAVFRAAVVHDFIPLDWPGYLPTVAKRMDYLSKLGRLKTFDTFCPVSEYTAGRLTEILGVPESRIRVTGASVRNQIYELRAGLGTVDSPYDGDNPYFLVVVGPDVRKNPEVAVKAVRFLTETRGQRVSLKVAGHFQEVQKTDLLKLAGHREGKGFLEFYAAIPDEEFVSLMAGAVATVVPSYIEGFSLPVVEASVCRVPVVASNCAAHLELLDRPEALFQSDDAVALSQKLGDLLDSPVLRVSLVESQANLASKFHEDAVGARFWAAIDAGFRKRATHAWAAKSKKPRLAFLSPYPPDRSGVARYTAMTMRAGEKLFHSDLYTDAPRPLTFDGNFGDGGGVSVAPLVVKPYDAVISVLGDSHYHSRIFDVFERFGGPCILHDARLIQTYVNRLGQAAFLKLTARLLGRTVTMEEASSWLHQRNPASLLLDLIVDRAAPLIVHTVTQQAQIQKRYDVRAEVIKCCPTFFFDDSELTVPAKQAIRHRHGIPPATFLISSFGIVAPEKGLDTCVLATELLRSWNIPAELHFVGGAGAAKPLVDRLSAMYGIAKHVHCGSGFVDEAAYRDFLIASDAGIQLRAYGFGQFSAALGDCISAGLPCVANEDLAQSCDAPDYVATVADSYSPLQVAEQLALIWEDRAARTAHEDARSTYLETHNFQHYGKRLIEVLGVG